MSNLHAAGVPQLNTPDIRRRYHDPEPQDSWPIVQRAQAGDQAAVDELYRRYRAKVYFFAYYKTLDGNTCPRSAGKANNLIADHFKSARVRLQLLTEQVEDGQQVDDSPEGRPDDTVADWMQHAVLRDCVTKLTPEQQWCLRLRFSRGLSVIETAEVMGKDLGAVKSLQYRATQQLRTLLPAGFDPRVPAARRLR